MSSPIAKNLMVAMVVAGCVVGPAAFAQDGREPLGGQPPAGSSPSVRDLDYQLKYQRAFEAVLWALPATSIYTYRKSAFNELGVRDNDILAFSAPATPKIECLTPNSTTPYIAGYTDLRGGPVVLELPVAGPDGSL